MDVAVLHQAAVAGAVKAYRRPRPRNTERVVVWQALLMGFVYILPSIDALVLRSRRLRRIVVINLVTGWTVIGWFVALVLAYRWRRRNVPFLPYVPPS